MTLTLRPATMEDAMILYVWRNHPSTRAMFRQEHPVDWETHRQWLQDVLVDPNRTLLVAVREGQAIGTVRFDLDGSDAEVSVTVSPEHRGVGVGTEILRLGTEQALLTCDRVVAHIKTSNTASVRAFQKAGYREVIRTETEVTLYAERSA